MMCEMGDMNYVSMAPIATWHRPTDPHGAFVDGPGVLLAGAPDGRLAGRTLAVKDLVDVVGRVTGAGNPVVAALREPATATAPAIERLVAAGATVVGRTVTDEFAYSLSGTNVHLGTPVNSAYPGHEPGGSSAGSAAAVAAGVVDVAVGTDTGGSIRVPASYCGLCGWRPTHGLVSLDGVVPLSPSFDTVGLLAPGDGAALLAVAAEVLAGGLPEAPPPAGIMVASDLLAALDPGDPGSGSAENVVALDIGDSGVSGDAAAVVAAAERLAAERDLPCEHRPLLPEPGGLDEAVTAFRALQSAEAWRIHGDLVRTGELQLGPGVAARFAAAAKVTPAEVEAANRVRSRVAAVVAAATAEGWLVAQPAAPGSALLLDASPEQKLRRRLAILAVTAPAGLAGAPVVVVPTRPLGQPPLGQPPLGLALVAAPGADATALAAIRV